jgi:2-hydroxychromene-2-carboxylate isomerase
MSATIWFDPSCPFTWSTSRWLRDAAAVRDEEVQWRLMSLAVLNAGGDVPEEYREPMRQSELASRVLVAAGDRDALYTALGTRVHEQGQPMTRETVAAAVADAGLPESLLDAYDDEARDEQVRAEHQESQDRVGQDAGSPVVAFGDGPGYFGPIVTGTPTGAAATRLWEAMTLLSQVGEFAELKRAR